MNHKHASQEENLTSQFDASYNFPEINSIQVRQWANFVYILQKLHFFDIEVYFYICNFNMLICNF